jgi:dienelactone hydrolase
MVLTRRWVPIGRFRSGSSPAADGSWTSARQAGDMRLARRSLLLVIAAILLAACGGTGVVPDPTWSAAPSTAPVRPTVTAPAGAPLGAPDPVTDPAVNPQADTSPVGISASPAETDVWVPAGDHRVPGTLMMPATVAGRRVPAVLLLHGDLSNRNESDNLFGRLAAALAASGIASLRIDFAGSGDSEEPDLSLDYPSMVADATASLEYLAADGAIDPAELAVLGLSRGGSIAATMAGTLPGVAALVSWSGAVSNGFDEDPDGHDEARDNGYLAVDLGDRDFLLSLAWFDTIEASHPLDDVVGYTGPVLAVVGSDDDIVPPEVSENFIDASASPDKSLHVIDGADHGFTAERQYGDEAIAVTTDWLAARLLP